MLLRLSNFRRVCLSRNNEKFVLQSHLCTKTASRGIYYISIKWILVDFCYDHSTSVAFCFCANSCWRNNMWSWTDVCTITNALWSCLQWASSVNFVGKWSCLFKPDVYRICRFWHGNLFKVICEQSVYYEFHGHTEWWLVSGVVFDCIWEVW